MELEPSKEEQKQPAPPRRGETDEQIRQRHRDALRDRNASPPPDFDPDIAEEYLDRLRRGDYTSPPGESQ